MHTWSPRGYAPRSLTASIRLVGAAPGAIHDECPVADRRHVSEEAMGKTGSTGPYSESVSTPPPSGALSSWARSCTQRGNHVVEDQRAAAGPGRERACPAARGPPAMRLARRTLDDRHHLHRAKIRPHLQPAGRLPTTGRRGDNPGRTTAEIMFHWGSLCGRRSRIRIRRNRCVVGAAVRSSAPDAYASSSFEA